MLLNPQWLKEERRACELLAAEEKWRTEREKGTERERKRDKRQETAQRVRGIKRERESGREQAGCAKRRRVLRLAGGEMKGRKREGGRDKGRGRERVRVHWIGIGGDCVMFEMRRRRRDCREWRERKVGERREEGGVRMQSQRRKRGKGGRRGERRDEKRKGQRQKAWKQVCSRYNPGGFHSLDENK